MSGHSVRWDRETDVLDNVQDVVYVVDAEMQLAFVNERIASAMGRPREELYGQPVETITEGVAVEEDGVERVVDAIRAVLKGDREEVRVELAANTDPLGEHYIETRVTPIERDGDVVAVVGVSRDVTQRHRYQLELETRSEELAVLNRLLRHDVRNDMAVVEGWLGELVERLDDDDRELAERAREAAAHTLELTETARSYASVVAEAAEPELEPVDVGALLRAELERHRELYPQASYEVEGDLPTVEVLATPMLQSAFTNILHNAVQHNPAECPTVIVGCVVGPDTVTIRVADDGPGIPEEIHDRAAGRTDVTLDDESAPLGQYLVRRLVDAADGTLSFEENDPKGTVVVVELDRPPAD